MRSKIIAWRGLSVTAFAIAIGVIFLSASAHATTLRKVTSGASPGQVSSVGPDPSTMIVAYYDVYEPAMDNGSGVGDNLLRLINPTSANGSVCAFIYVFDNEEEMGACCGCPVSPNGLAQFSVEKNLLSNWGISSFGDASGVIDIVTGLPNTAIFIASLGISVPACDPGSSVTPVGNLSGYITHNQAIAQQPFSSTGVATPTGATTSLTEVSLFDEGAADSAEGPFLVSTCHFLETNGSGRGLCYCVPPFGDALPVPFLPAG